MDSHDVFENLSFSITCFYDRSLRQPIWPMRNADHDERTWDQELLPIGRPVAPYPIGTRPCLTRTTDASNTAPSTALCATTELPMRSCSLGQRVNPVGLASIAPLSRTFKRSFRGIGSFHAPPRSPTQFSICFSNPGSLMIFKTASAS